MDGLGPDGKPVKRRRRDVPRTNGTHEDSIDTQGAATKDIERQAAEPSSVAQRRGGECPIPKPSGYLGRVLGFNYENGIKPIVEIQSVKSDSDGV